MFDSYKLAKRNRAKQEAKEKTEEALEEGKMDVALMQNQRNVRITPKMKEDAIKLLKLMGCPVIEVMRKLRLFGKAPCEAEAQCAELCKGNKIYATATEDMDALTFATPILLRGFNTKKEPIYEINFQQMLEELQLSYEQFVDLCILFVKCGCDYTDKIEGIGPATAYKLIQEYKNIEAILHMIEKEGSKKEKYKIPKEFHYIDSRELFTKPVVTKWEDLTEALKWQKPSEEELKKFLVEEKGFSVARVEGGLKRINKKDLSGYQPRIENFFIKSQKVVSSSVSKDDKKKKDTKKEAAKKKISK